MKSTYVEMPLNNRKAIDFQIDAIINQKATPLTKFYEEMKRKYVLPSRDLLEMDKMHF